MWNLVWILHCGSHDVQVLTELEQIPLDFLPLVMTVQLLEYCLTIMSFACTELSYKDRWFQNACVSHKLDYFCVFCIQHFIPSICIFIQICMQLGMFTYTLMYTQLRWFGVHFVLEARNKGSDKIIQCSQVQQRPAVCRIIERGLRV